jgi:hypothetical protein
MEIFVFSALGLLVGILLVLWLVTRIRYRVGSRHMKVLLFGICLRRVPLADIDSVSKRPGPGWTERWWSTTSPKHRLLIIRRRRGLFRNVAVTPKNRYVFKAELERGIQRVGGALPTAPPEPDTPVEDEADPPRAR